MRIEYVKDSEPHFVGTVITVADEVGAALIEKGVAKEVDPRTPEKNVAADVSQDGMSLTDKRKRGIAPEGYEGDPAEVDDEVASMTPAELKKALEEKGLPTTGKKAELQARLRESNA